MRISKLSTDRATDVLCELTPYIANIVSDEELLEELKKAVDRKDIVNKAQWLAVGAEKITKILPILLKKHKYDVFGILAVMNEKAVEEIAKQNFLATLKQAKAAFKDKELIDFFKSCMDAEEGE